MLLALYMKKVLCKLYIYIVFDINLNISYYIYIICIIINYNQLKCSYWHFKVFISENSWAITDQYLARLPLIEFLRNSWMIMLCCTICIMKQCLHIAWFNMISLETVWEMYCYSWFVVMKMRPILKLTVNYESRNEAMFCILLMHLC